MPQQAIEVILTRQLAAHLSLPTFLVDAEGQVLDFNQAAQRALGDRLDKAQSLTARELAAFFEARDSSGAPVPAEELPLVIAVEERHPAHARLRIRSADDSEDREVAITAVPLIGQGHRFLGAIAFFWELPS